MNANCFFIPHDQHPCDGRLVRCHLIPQQLLKQTKQYKHMANPTERTRFLFDPRSWVWGCGGLMGISGHHGRFDSHQFKLGRRQLPRATEELAAELGLDWWLDRTYGPTRTRHKRCILRY